MTSDSTSPATKKDIRMLMDEIGKLYNANERWKNEIEDKMERWKQEMKEHFDVVAENIKHDFLHGAIPDKVEQHEDRIVRLEQHVGLAV